MKVINIIKEHLKSQGFDGLYNDQDPTSAGSRSCGCLIDDLGPCGSLEDECEPGYLIKCECVDYVQSPIYKHALCKNCYPGSRLELRDVSSELVETLEDIIKTVTTKSHLQPGSDEIIEAKKLIIKARRLEDLMM